MRRPLFFGTNRGAGNPARGPLCGAANPGRGPLWGRLLGGQGRLKAVHNAGRFALLAGALLVSSACMVGPNYKRPAAPQTPAFKEPPPEGWKEAQPNDGAIKGKWWEIYNDPQLNALEEQVSISNQNVLAAEANFRAARYAVGIARAGLYPTVSVGPTVGVGQSSSSTVGNGHAPVAALFDLSATPSWTADIWGSVRRGVRASEATAQADFALLENARLSYQSELAEDYFELHGTDGDIDLLDRTTKSYEEYLTLTQNRYKAGVASGGDVALAQTQLDTTRAQLIDLGVARAQYEHAIAVLTGADPSSFSIPVKALSAIPPPVPIGVPSQLLERRPDIAGSERVMAAANAQIGVATAAFYPNLTLTTDGGLESAAFKHLFDISSRFWSLGGSASESIFDAGLRRATVMQYEAIYNGDVDSYRQTVLSAFQQVEDALAAERILSQQVQQQEQAEKSAQQVVDLETARYETGVDPYIDVVTAKATLLADEQTLATLHTQAMTASVQLIEALGGGWDSTQLPTPQQVTTKIAPAESAIQR